MRNTPLILVAIALLPFDGCVSAAPAPIRDSKNILLNMAVTYPDKNQSVKAVVVIVHGLNFKPERMDDWSGLLTSHGAISMRFSLYGHDKDIQLMREVNSQIWRRQFDMGMEQAHKLSKRHGVPMVFIGYSLGGLIGIDWVTRQRTSDNVFSKMVLLAPAIATPWYSDAAIVLLPHLDQTMIIPGPNPKESRAHYGSSVNAYRALFDLKASVFDASFKNANIDTLLIIDRNDELIPFNEIRNIVNCYHLSRWQIVLIDNKYAKANSGFRHMIADKLSVGDKVWNKISSQVIEHLSPILTEPNQNECPKR